MGPLSKNFDLRRDHKKNSYERRDLLRVSRRKEPILGYVPKNDEKKNSGWKEFKKMRIYKFV